MIGMKQAALALALLGVATAAAAQDYPARPVRMVVAFAPGGVADLTGRIVAEGLAKRLNQPFVVDNRPGASGNIGTAHVAQSAPDGYTLIMGTIATQSVNNHLYSSPGYDGIADFAPVSLTIEVPNLIIVRNGLPVKTLQELVAHAKANPGKLNYGSTGAGGSQYLIMELLKSKFGVDILHVPYSGSSRIQQALQASEVDVAADNITTAVPQVRGGNVRALALTASARSPAAPEVPTVIEAGAPDLVVTAWLGVLAPARTPEPVVRLLSENIGKVMEDPTVQERLRALGGRPLSSTPEQFRQHIATESQRWGALLRSLKIEKQ